MDNLKRRVPEDPTKINLNQQWEVEYWTKNWGYQQANFVQSLQKLEFTLLM